MSFPVTRVRQKLPTQQELPSAGDAPTDNRNADLLVDVLLVQSR